MFYLFFMGYVTLKHRYKTYLGEIDLITVKRKVLVIVEVKFRKNVSNLEEILTDSQKNRIRRAALIFISNSRKYQNYGVRFDFVLVSLNGIRHFKDFWD